MKIRNLWKICFVLPLLCACENGEKTSSIPDSVTSSEKDETLAFDTYHLSLAVGESYRIRLTKGAEEVLHATWTSSDETIASVSSMGTVFAVSTGVTHVKAVVEGKALLCEVTVKPKDIKAEEALYFKLNVTSLSLYVGDTYPITPTLLEDGEPVEGTYEATSTNEAVASLDFSTWNVTALSQGTATFTITAKKGDAKAVTTLSVIAYEK